jgi:hypothetical protein
VNWFYVFLRTFPFWGIPVGFALIGTFLRTKKKAYLFLGIILVALSVLFLFNRGHDTAVPFFHEVFNEGKLR